MERTKSGKYRRGDPAIGEMMINKELEKYNITVADIKQIPDEKIEGKEWFIHYTFNSEEERKEWKDWCWNFLRKEVTPAYTIRELKREWPWFDLMYSLKDSYR